DWAPRALWWSVSEAEIDDTLADSFPASDPPAWTLGVEPTGEELLALADGLHSIEPLFPHEK
ncbi:MAG TPA: hypothetical protein DCE44_11095, partial [Verrucomicrobiales bacterium]|nr:hypothetical protein [Verrucomicrobiales bacterium]